MSNLTDKFPNADELNIQVQGYHTPYQPYILATEVLEELEKRLGSGKQYTTFPNKISDEEKAKVEAAGYIVTRNTIDAKNLDGSGDVYIGFQVAVNETAASGDRLMVISQEETNGIEGGGGGGGGTGDYNALSNKPQINGNILTGNKTAANLGLQETISDIGTIRSGSEAGATAVQTIQIDGTAQTKTNGVVNLPAYPTALPASDTTSTYSPSGTVPVNGTAVAAALGPLDAEIGVIANASAKNFCPKETETSTGSGFTSDVPVNIPAGTYILSFTGTLAYTASLSLYKALPHSGNGLGIINLSATTGAQSVEFTISETAKYIAFYHNGSGNSLTNIMVRPASITDSTFQPYALSNPVITPALIEQVDSGSKNIVCPIIRTLLWQGITYVSTGDGVVSASGTADSNPSRYAPATAFLLPAGSYVMAGCPTGGSDTTYRQDLYASSDGTNFVLHENKIDYGNGVAFTLTTQLYVRPTFRFQQGYIANNLIFKPMICTAADYAISPAFVPYRPSWQKMWEMIQELQSRIHGETVDLLTEPYASHLYNKYFDDSTGQVDDSARPNRVLCDLFIDIPDDRSSYTVQTAVSGSAGQFICYFYDANENFLPSQTDTSWVDSSTFKIIPNAKKLRVLMRVSSNADIAIGNISTFKVLFR